MVGALYRVPCKKPLRRPVSDGHTERAKNAKAFIQQNLAHESWPFLNGEGGSAACIRSKTSIRR